MRKEYDFSKGVRGATIPPDPRKTRITIRIDTKILNWFRQQVHEAGGGGYQTMINDALKNHIESYKCRNQELFSCVIESKRKLGDSANIHQAKEDQEKA